MFNTTQLPTSVYRSHPYKTCWGRFAIRRSSRGQPQRCLGNSV